MFPHVVFPVGFGTTVYEGYNDFAEEDYTPQLDYKGAYGKTHIYTVAALVSV